MPPTNFNTANQTFRQLFGNGLTYVVPQFQRDYSWTEQEWTELWEDILATHAPDGEPAHYMGYLVLQTYDEKSFVVIDGQQRLTTLTLVILGALAHLKRLLESGHDGEATAKRMEIIRASYISYFDSTTLAARAKLHLNRTSDAYFQNYIVPLERLPIRGIKPAERALRQAFEWFSDKVAAHIRKLGGDEGAATAQFVESMSDRLFFTVIKVADELNAYRVFETLNARGVRLSATDLLKNHLFSVMHRDGDHEIQVQRLEGRWERLVGQLGGGQLTDYVRVHWNSRNPPVRQSELFRTLRRKVPDKEAAFALLRGLDEDLDTYLNLTNPTESDWSPKLKSLAQTLKLFGVKQPIPMLLCAWRLLTPEGFERFLGAVVRASFRYNVVGNGSTAEQERAYAQAVARMLRGEVRNDSEAIALLKPVYPSDESFKAAFAEFTLRTTDARNNRVARYILGEIERHLGGIQPELVSDAVSIEHVLPRNPEDGWEAFSDLDASAFGYRLGNMTLLEAAANRVVGNSGYFEKLPAYQSSRFLITRKLAEDYGDWGPETVESRQRWLASQACAIWRISQFD